MKKSSLTYLLGLLFICLIMLAATSVKYVGNFYGNGMGITNIQESSLVYPPVNPSSGLVLTSTSSNTAAWLGAAITGVLQTNSMIVVRTNFVSGFIYTNSLNVPLLVSANAIYTTAGVTGDAGVALWIAGSGGTTNIVSASTTIAVTLAQTYTNELTGIVPIGCTYTYTNVSTGAGNSGSLLNGQYAYMQSVVVAPTSTYRVWRGLLSQSGTATPTGTVLENSLGGTITWARTSPGVYTATLTGAFPANKTFISPKIFPVSDFSAAWTVFHTSANVLTFDNGIASDDLLGPDQDLTILVYP